MAFQVVVTDGFCGADAQAVDGFVFQLFPQIMIMTDGGPNGATQVMVERIYKYGFRYFKMGYASAFSWILFLIIMVCTAIQMRGQKRWVNYDA